MRYAVLSAALSAALLVACAAAPTNELRAAYDRTAASCSNGHSGGVIVTLHNSIEPHVYLEKLRARAAEGDEFHHHYTHTIRGVAVKLSDESLNRVFEDEHTHAVHADCHMKLKLPHAPVLLGSRVEEPQQERKPRAKHALVLDGLEDSATVQNEEDFVKAGVERRGSVSVATARSYWNCVLSALCALRPASRVCGACPACACTHYHARLVGRCAPSQGASTGSTPSKASTTRTSLVT